MAKSRSCHRLVSTLGHNNSREAYRASNNGCMPISGTGGYSFTCMVIEPEEYSASLRWEKSIGEEGLQRLREHHFAVKWLFFS